MRIRWLLYYCLLSGVALPGCQRAEVPQPKPAAELPRELPGLHNLHRVDDRLWSGSSPEVGAGFESLKKLGVHTIISVDAARPEVGEAKKHGLRYVHLPIGYDGIPRDRLLAIARAVRDLPGPVYLHCHHGRHRGPAAAAAVRLCLDPTYTPDGALALMKEAGTDPRYRGLLAMAQLAPRPSPQDIDSADGRFPEVAEVPPLAEAMVAIDGHWDAIKRLRAAHWVVTKSEATGVSQTPLLLAEQFRELSRLPESSQRGSEYRALLGQGERGAGELRKLLEAVKTGPMDDKAAEKAYQTIASSCQTCHERFRDSPRNQ